MARRSSPSLRSASMRFRDAAVCEWFALVALFVALVVILSGALATILPLLVASA